MQYVTFSSHLHKFHSQMEDISFTSSLVAILVVPNMWLQQAVNSVRLTVCGHGAGFPGSIPDTELQHEEDAQVKRWSVESNFSQGACVEQRVLFPEPHPPQGGHFHSCARVGLMVSGLPFLTARLPPGLLGELPAFPGPLSGALGGPVQLLLQKESPLSRRPVSLPGAVDARAPDHGNAMAPFVGNAAPTSRC